MLEQFVKAVLDKLMAEKYPYLTLPTVIYATVKSARQLKETFDLDGLTFVNEDGGGSYRGHITAHWNVYDLAVVDRFGMDASAFPLLTGVRSRAQFRAGAVVALALAYGDAPVILGEVSV